MSHGIDLRLLLQFPPLPPFPPWVFVYPSFMFPVHLFFSASRGDTRFLFSFPPKDSSDRIWGELACSRAERCIPTTAWLALHSSLDERGRRRVRRVEGELKRKVRRVRGSWGGGGEGVLSREATSSQCVESIFSRVNRGIPAHWSWLHSRGRVVGGWRRSVVSSWMWMNDRLPPSSPPSQHPTGKKHCATNRPTSSQSDAFSSASHAGCTHAPLQHATKNNNNDNDNNVLLVQQIVTLKYTWCSPTQQCKNSSWLQGDDVFLEAYPELLVPSGFWIIAENDFSVTNTSVWYRWAGFWNNIFFQIHLPYAVFVTGKLQRLSKPSLPNQSIVYPTKK